MKLMKSAFLDRYMIIGGWGTDMFLRQRISREPAAETGAQVGG
jgi:hypothetical protein